MSFTINTDDYIAQFYEGSEIHESLFVGSIWNTPSLYGRYKAHKITKQTFTKTIWYFYFEIGRRMYENGIRDFNEAATYSFITSQKEETGKKSFFDTYDHFGGYSTIEDLIRECKGKQVNDEYHLSEVQKYESLRNMQTEKIIDVQDSEYIDKVITMSLKELQAYFTYKVKTSFAQVNSGEVLQYNVTEDLDDVIDLLDEGTRMGLPLYQSPRLTSTINGQKLGNFMILALSSGVGKSSFITEKNVLAIFEHNIKALDPNSGLSFEKAIIFVNEEGKVQWQARLLATVVNRVLKKGIPRKEISKGHFTPETKKALREAADWLRQNQPDFIKLIVLKKYRIQDVINNIELLRPLGYSHVYFDTFKPEASNQADRWLAFSNSAQELHDTIKEENYNCATLATVQLKIGKEFRYLDLDSIGKSPEIAEVAAVVMAGRIVYDDEYEGGKNAIDCFNLKKNEDTGEWEEVKYELREKKKYLVLFLPKNREGTEDLQIVFEMNLDFNSWKEVAWARVKNTGYNR